MNTIEALQKWVYGHKSRTVEIDIDDGYGANCGWYVKLKRLRAITPEYRVDVVEVSEASMMYAFSCGRPENDDIDPEWPGLEKVILEALRQAEEKVL